MCTFNIYNLSEENSDIMWINEWECNSNDDCTARNSVCSDGLCQCSPEYIFNADMTACVKGNTVSLKLYYFPKLIIIGRHVDKEIIVSQLQLDLTIRARKQCSVRLISWAVLNAWKMSAYVGLVTIIYTVDVTNTSVSDFFNSIYYIFLYCWWWRPYNNIVNT